MRIFSIVTKTAIVLILHFYSVKGIGQIKTPIKAGLLFEQISLPHLTNYKDHLGLGFTLGTEFHCAGK